jgi:hypothetical protein
MERRLIVGATTGGAEYLEFPLIIVRIDGTAWSAEAFDPESRIASSQTFATKGEYMFFMLVSCGVPQPYRYVDFTKEGDGWKFSFGQKFDMNADGIVTQTTPMQEGRVVYGVEKVSRLFRHLHHHPQ